MKGWFAARLCWCILVQLIGASMIFGAQDPNLILGSASVSNNQFQFTLNGVSGISYTIQASTNLSDWVAVATNTDPNATRVITITNSPDGQCFYRATGVLPSPSGFALLAVQEINLFGSGTVDSFDSSVGPYSSTNRGAGGNIGTDSMATNAVQVGIAHVYGVVNTGPGGGVTVATGAVGDINWNATQVGIEPGWSNDTMNLSFPSNAPPVGPFLTPTVTATNATNITYLSSGAYQVSTYTSSDSLHPMIVTGNAILYVTGNFTVEGSGYVAIMPGASLTLYVGGSTITIAGGGLVNDTGLASQCTLIGLSSSFSFITYSGSSAFIGTVNAPEADVIFSGGAGVYGAIVANSITLSGGSSVHYDESLGR